MPYYHTVFPGRETLATWSDSAPSGSPVYATSTKKLRTLSEEDTGFRTRPAKNGVSSLVPSSSVDPYTWFLSYQDLKRDNAIKSGFDPSVFHADTGHSWNFERKEITQPLWDFSYNTGYDLYSFRNCLPVDRVGGIDTGFHIPATDLENWAALQYGRMAPTGSSFSFAAFTGELREGLPKLISSAYRARTLTGIAKGAGKDYLNVEFGWMPMLNDLRTLAQALLEASYGLYRPFGAVRRNRTMNPRIETLESQNPSGLTNIRVTNGSDYTGPAGISANTSIIRKTTIDRWIEGEFVYLPKAGFDASNYFDRLETLMSHDITPAVLWQLTPWSWLVDWYWNIGTALSSAEAATNQRVLSSFCYAMEHTETSVSYRFSDAVNQYPYTGPRNHHQTWRYTRKRRIKANPFGYTGTPNTTLSSGQLGILGALSLTKALR